MLYYHSSPAAELDLTDTDDICLTDDAVAAATYGGAASHLHTFTVEGLTVADDDDIRAAAATVPSLVDDWTGEVNVTYEFEMADDERVRDALSDAGFDAVEYRDLTEDNAAEHATLRVFGAGVARLVEVA